MWRSTIPLTLWAEAEDSAVNLDSVVPFYSDRAYDPLLLFYPLPDDLVIKAKNKQTSAIISWTVSDLGFSNLSSVGDVDGKPTWKASSSTEGSTTHNSTAPRDKMNPFGSSLMDNPGAESRRDDQSDNTTTSLYSQSPATTQNPAPWRENNENDEEDYPNIPTGSDTRPYPSSNAPELDSPVSFRPPSFVVEGQSPISISTRGESHYSPTTPRINKDDEDENGEYTSISGASIHSTSTTSRWIRSSSVAATPSGSPFVYDHSFTHPDGEAMRRTAFGAEYPRDSDIGQFMTISTDPPSQDNPNTSDSCIDLGLVTPFLRLLRLTCETK
ncbi:hypothetical protein D9757_013002 [Collybiopsis confluens]|uniref:Uncharacterized protein n=1 Tax=Collybiopsis confluens TaxID=2823264 RepID=A0A8H5G2R7_9AGAR|nr:hypothetical protein D9757_013002 [Collybiopsis confluens]